MGIHIGNEIRKVAAERGISATELGRRVGKSRQTIASMYENDSIRTDDLLLISKALGFNFFSLWTDLGEQAATPLSSVSLTLNLPAGRAREVLVAAFGEVFAAKISGETHNKDQS